LIGSTLDVDWIHIGALQAQVVEVEKETSKVEWLKTSNVQV
jgi:hypothetical protein